jgi:hypothetical protein
LGQENDFRFRDELANLSGGFNSIQIWEADVQQDQIWAQLYCLLNRFQAVGHFADDLQIARCGQRLGDKLPKGREVLDDDNAH